MALRARDGWLVLLNLVGQTMENVGIIHWFTALGDNRDVFWVLLTTGIAYFLFFCALYVMTYHRYPHDDKRTALADRVAVLEEGGVAIAPAVAFWPSRREARDAVLVGLGNAMYGYCIIYSADPQRTPPLVQQCLFNGGLLFTMFANHLILGHKWSRYFHPYAVGSLLCVLTGAVIALLPLIEETAHSGASTHFLFVALFTTGMGFNVVFNVMQRWHLDRHLLSETPNLLFDFPPYRMLIKTRLLAVQTFSVIVFYTVVFWTDFIGTIGSVSSWSEFLHDGRVVMGTTFLPWLWGEDGSAGVVALVANLGYIISFWAALSMNEFATGFTAVANQVVPFVTSFIFSFVPSLNQTEIEVGWGVLIPSLLFSLVGATLWYLYELHVEETEEVKVSHVGARVGDTATVRERLILKYVNASSDDVHFANGAV